jgi:outer membrane protein W
LKKHWFLKSTLIALGMVMAISMSNLSSAEGLAGKGSIGASIGVMKFASGDDWTDGSARLIGNAVIKYNINNSWAVTLEGGAGWNNYGTSLPDSLKFGSSDTLGVVFPITIGAQYRFQLNEGKIWPQFGAGIGIYNLGIKDSPNTWARNTSTGDRLTWTTFGLWGKAGAEYMFSERVGMNFDFLFHFFDATDDNLSRVDPCIPLPGEEDCEDYIPRFTTSSTSFIQGRIGVNYYFGIGGGDDDDEGENDDEAEDDLLEGLD